MNNLLFQIPLFLLLLLSLVVVSIVIAFPYPDFPLQRTPNCPDKCGNVTIPFPFGVRPDCSLSDWYEIHCINDSIPLLKKLYLQVLNIYLPSHGYSNEFDITVNYPIIYSNSSCTPPYYKVSQTQVTFEGSPFYISAHNKLIVVGCEQPILLRGSDNSYQGCTTDCSGNNTNRYSSCNGVYCCQSGIPDGLQSFNVTLERNNSSGASGGDQTCHFAFFVNSTWFEPGSTDLYAIRDGGYAPVVLKWGIMDADYLKSIGLNLSGSTDTAWCENISLNVNTTIFECRCKYGFYGNSYIKDGCQDFNECEEPYGMCAYFHKCKNTRGGYICIKDKMLFIIIGICSSFGPLLLIFTGWWLFKLIKKRREANLRAKFFKRNGGLILQHQLSSPDGHVEKGRLFNSKELNKATDNFNEDRILGKGGQGTVYKGMLSDGTIVAIKKSVAIDEQDVEPFINEVFILSLINHRNVVKLLGCCLETEVPLLVYEFISNGTLYQYLHDNELLPSWEERLCIAVEVAGALFYLHSSASIPIYHRDIKSSNILLGDKYRAKVADFGTSRSVALDQTHVTTIVQGTFGYLDPEYFQSSQFTDKSDVYSFGVVLVELLTRQKPVCSLRANEGRSLATYFIICMEENRLFDIIDQPILEKGNAEELVAVANLAKRCLNLKGRKRPTMKEVVMELEGIRNLGGHSASRVDENQGIASDQEIIGTSVANEALALSGGEMDTYTICVSDVQPLMPSQTW